MEILIFTIMACVIIYLMYDNRKLERISRIAIKAAIKEQIKRKTLEIIVYSRELDNKDIFDGETLYEDV